MKKLLIVLITFVLLTDSVIAWDPPEVICVLEGHGEQPSEFARDFCWAGDQNSDGCDDILANDDPFTNNNAMNYTNQVHLYYGGRNMDSDPDFSFNTNRERFGIGYGVGYLGYYQADTPPYIILENIYYEHELDWRESAREIYLFESNDSLDNEPEFQMRRLRANGYFLGRGHNTRPTDLNGDGFHDLIAIQLITDSTSHLVAFWGGEEPDTIPDWFATIDVSYRLMGSNNISSGYDVNGDGYEDLLFRGRSGNNDYYGKIFLGGSPMDTIPAVYGSGFYYDGFSMFPDVNGDGYDDWGYYTHLANEDDGFRLFYGSEEPDFEYDVVLEGKRRLWRNYGDIAGGDFNHDGWGDIVTTILAYDPSNSEIHIHFGREQINPRADIAVFCDQQYGERFWDNGYYVGAVGDYNGDGVDDFVTRNMRNEEPGYLLVLAGNRRWVSVEDGGVAPEQFELVINASPNPFNSSVRLECTIPAPGIWELTVFDISGRRVQNLLTDELERGSYQYAWQPNNLSQGLYFVRLSNSIELGNNEVVKKVLYLK